MIFTGNYTFLFLHDVPIMVNILSIEAGDTLIEHIDVVDVFCFKT